MSLSGFPFMRLPKVPYLVKYETVENEFWRIGCDLKFGGVLAHASYKGSPNWVDDAPILDRGREIQGALLTGFTHSGKHFHWDTVNPTHATGNNGRNPSELLEWEKGDGWLEGVVRANDYAPGGLSTYNGPTRVKLLNGRYPWTGWYLRFRYDLRGRAIHQWNEWWHEDDFPHQMFRISLTHHFYSPLCQRFLVNENKRVIGSWRDDRINDSAIVFKVGEYPVHLHVSGAVDGFRATLHSWHRPDKIEYVDGRPQQARPGEATSNNLEVQAHIERPWPRGQRLTAESVVAAEDL